MNKEELSRNWLAHVRAYPRYQSKPDPGLFDHTAVSEHPLRRIGRRSGWLRRKSGLFLPAPMPDSNARFKIWEKPGETHTPALPHSLLGQQPHDTFFDYHPSFSSRSSFILRIHGGSFHGHDHTLFDRDFLPIDSEPPYWALNCGLPGTLFRRRLPRPVFLKGSVLVLSAPAGGGNIWHFLFDSLPKIKLIADAGVSLNDFDHILIDTFKMPYVAEALDRLGIDRKKVIESETQPLITAEELTYVTLGCLLPPDPWVLNWLRSIFLQDASTIGRRHARASMGDDALETGESQSYDRAYSTTATRKIFISRAGATRRRLHGEETIVKRLQADGFEAVALEKLSFKEQVKLMSEARAVVASHGAGLTNLTWCRPGTKVVELFAAEYVNVCYWNISRMLGLEYACALGEPAMGHDLPPRAVLDMQRLQADQVFQDPKQLAAEIALLTR